MSAGSHSPGSGSGVSPERPDLNKLFAEKARSEIAAAEALIHDGTVSSGDAFAQVLLIKGVAGPAEESGDEALSGPDGVAACKALEAVGLDSKRVYRMLSRPAGGESDAKTLKRLAALIEAVDPLIVIALDSIAGADLSAATGLPGLEPGHPSEYRGRTILAVDGLESSLRSESAKRRVWNQLKALDGVLKIRV